MMQTTTKPDPKLRQVGSSLQRMAFVWVGVGLIAFAAALALTYEPSFAGPSEAVLTVLPFVVLAAMTLSLARHPWNLSSAVYAAALVVTWVGWAVLVLDDDRWSILTFALYAVCFSSGRVSGLVLSALVSVVWSIAWLDLHHRSRSDSWIGSATLTRGLCHYERLRSCAKSHRAIRTC